MSITVVEVMRDMGIEVTSKLSWEIGNVVRDLWMTQHHGALPDKELRTKTSGHGSHFLAVYPENWRDRIEDVVRFHRAQKARQGTLF